jgi:hypothetical protein
MLTAKSQEIDKALPPKNWTPDLGFERKKT